MNKDQVVRLQEVLEELQDSDAVIILAINDAHEDEEDDVIDTFAIHKSGEELNELTLASIYTAAAQNSIARTVDEINAAIENAED